MEEVRIGKEAKGAVTRSHKSQTMRRWQFILKERLGVAFKVSGRLDDGISDP